VEMDNQTNKTEFYVNAELCREAWFTAQRHAGLFSFNTMHTGSRREFLCVRQIRNACRIAARSKGTFPLEFKVPAMSPSFDVGSISVKYFLKLTVSFSGMFTGAKLPATMPVLIGTIPYFPQSSSGPRTMETRPTEPPPTQLKPPAPSSSLEVEVPENSSISFKESTFGGNTKKKGKTSKTTSKTKKTSKTTEADQSTDDKPKDFNPKYIYYDKVPETVDKSRR